MNMQRIGTFEVKVRITLALFLTVLGVLFVLGFYYLDHYRTTLTFAAAMLGGIGVLYSAFYSAQTLRIGIHRDKIRCALESTSKLHGIELVKVRTLVVDELSDPNIPGAKIYDIIISDKDKHDAVRTVLNHFEDISIAIQKGYADEEVVYLSLYFLAPHIFRTLEPYIKTHRQKMQCKDGWSELDRLVKSWESGIYLYDGSKIKATT